MLGWQTLTALTHTHIKEDWRAGQQSALQTDHQHTRTHTHNCQTDSKEWRSGSFRNITIHLQNNRVISWAYQSRAPPNCFTLRSGEFKFRPSLQSDNHSHLAECPFMSHYFRLSSSILYFVFRSKFPQNMREQRESRVINVSLVKLQGRRIPKQVVVNTLRCKNGWFTIQCLRLVFIKSEHLWIPHLISFNLDSTMYK